MERFPEELNNRRNEARIRAAVTMKQFGYHSV